MLIKMSYNTIKEINKNVCFRCKSTRNTESVELVIKGRIVSTGYYSWINRPWQSFDFASAMEKAWGSATLSTHHNRLIKKWIDNGGRRAIKRISDQNKTTAMVASLGAIFGGNQKESNDWKTRMLKAGLPSLSMPSDWETLSEDEKTIRLDKVIKEMGK